VGAGSIVEPLWCGRCAPLQAREGIDNSLMAYLFGQAGSSFAGVVAGGGIRATRERSGFDADITNPSHDVVGNGLTRIHLHNLDRIGLIMGTEDEMSVG
jgi:hypothetical protein